ncbi:MAG: hypothetical protein JWQ30_1036 [Sediminibacterium sp.]|nr:hypothetical protein [Sediminibacterium sp.]
MKYSPTEIARQFLFVREAGPNTGQRVEGIQRWCGGIAGQSWCCYFATMILDIFFQGSSPIPRLGACQDVYAMAKKNGWLTDNPIKDDLYIYVDANDHAHHIGIVTEDGGSSGIAGNTSADGTSSNGDRVAEHVLITNRARIKFIHYPR